METIPCPSSSVPESPMYRVIVNSLSTHVAVLDEEGRIIETNQAWREFGRKNGLPDRLLDGIGLNYLAICETDQENGGRDIATAIRRVILGEWQEFCIQYPCHSPTEQRWFSLRVVPYRDCEAKRVIVTHEDITPIMLAQEQLRQQEAELQEKKEKLEETNIALKILLEQRQRDLEQLEDRILANIRELTLPSMEKLRASAVNERQRTLADIVIEHLGDVISPLLGRLTALNALLTPQEMEVAALVRQGKSSQEIADLLTVSVATVSFHRKKLRRKLGLHRTSGNLRSFLLALR